MTRISSAPRGLNPVLDQLINSRGDTAAAGNADSGQTPAFDAHLARFSPGGKANAQSDDALASNIAAGKAASHQNESADAVTSLFAALTGDNERPADAAALQNGNLTGLVAEDKLPQEDGPDPASALFAALNGSDHTGTTGSSVQNQSPISDLLSLAAKTNPRQASAAPGSGSVRHAAHKPTVSGVANLKGGSESDKSQDQTANPSSDIAASAQVTIAALAGSLTPQTPPALQAQRKEAPSPGTGANFSPIRGGLMNAQSLSEPDVQSASDGVHFPAQNDSFDQFGGDASSSGESSHQTIKMTVSSIQAETHFAPVQQLSPTQQIVDFIDTAAGSGVAADAGSDAAASSADMTSSATAAVSGSPLKTLTLALEPDALGTVTITMRLVNSNLDLKVEAEKPETASLIEKDKGNLSDKLQSLGYSVDSMVVKTAMAQSSHLDPSNDQATAGQGQQAGEDASASGSFQHGGRNTNDQSPAQTGRQAGGGFNQETGSSDPSLRSLSDGVYV